MNNRSKSLAYEIDTVVQTVVEDGRTHLNDEEAMHLLRISERILKEYMNELNKNS